MVFNFLKYNYGDLGMLKGNSLLKYDQFGNKILAGSKNQYLELCFMTPMWQLWLLGIINS